MSNWAHETHERSQMGDAHSDTKISPRVGDLELIRESLVAVVNEMRANLIHSSYSSIIYEGHDFSCALISASGSLVAQSLADHPIHIFAIPYSTSEVLKKFKSDINEGDIFLHNDPYTGGTHLNDVLMLYPVFSREKLAMFAATRCHWGDVGGMTAGSLSGRVREIYQEGLRIVPTRICERGHMNEGFLSLLFDNMRFPDERRGDFNAMLGTCKKSAEHLQRLFQRYGKRVLLNGIDELLIKSERVMRQRIAEAPDGEYHSEAYLDNSGQNNEPVLGCLKLTIRGDNIIADFTGSSPQTDGPINVGPAIALNSVATVVKSFFDAHTPINEGSFRPIEIVNPLGSFLNATHPAPCGGMAECRALVTALAIAALGQALPNKRLGDLKGTANHVYLSGEMCQGDHYLMYEYPAGGTGASLGLDGNNGVRAFNEGDFNAVWAAEMVKSQCPLQVHSYAIREGSCGDGQYRGGYGIRREFRILSDRTNLSILSDHCVIPPFGVAGGKSAAANAFSVLRKGRQVDVSSVPGKVSGFELMAGDLLRVETAGGGGFGDCLDRPGMKVLEDVTLGFLTIDEAYHRYGVVIDASGYVDEEATASLRSQLRRVRIMVPLVLETCDFFEGQRRYFRISPNVASALKIHSDALVEAAAASCSAALRGWARVDINAAGLPIGPRGMRVLGATNGDLVELRAVSTYPEW